MSGTIVCSKCKGTIPADAERCMHCGSWFGPNKVAETKLKMAVIVAFMLVALVVLVLAL